MKLKGSNLLLSALLVLALAALLAILPSWLGTAVSIDASGTDLERAQAEYVPQLESIDRDFSEPSAWGEREREDLQRALDNLQSRDRAVVGTFTVGDSVEFSKPSAIGASEKRKLQSHLMLREDGDLAEELEDLLQGLAAEHAPAFGARAVSRKGRAFQVLWTRCSEGTHDETLVSALGCVVDYSLSAEREQARRLGRLLFGLGVGVLCLLAVAVGVLVLFLRRARRDALLKTTFVSNVSHELRTPLTSLLSYAEMLSSGRCRTEEKKAKALGVILDEGRRLNRMILELLDFSRLERGTRRYETEDFDLAATVRETVERLGGRFAEHGITVEAPDAVAVASDRDTVRQVLENLLTNAAKYAAKDGPVEVSVKVRAGRVKLAVADRGPGLTRAQMKKAFAPFWRADNSTTRETNGYGIGLAVARGYARGLGGDLSVEARPGGGCTFTFEFPIRQ